MIRVFGLPKAKARAGFLKTLRIVKRVHSRQIVHRDLKPENIMVTQAGELVLIDFGTAKDVEFNIRSKGNSSTGRRYFENYIGTPQYMAPECVHNWSSGFESDVWSLGCLYYFLMSGFPPFLDGSEYLIYKRSLNQEPIYYDFLFDQFDRIVIESMLKKKKEERITLELLL